jgi:hypothetical protein
MFPAGSENKIRVPVKAILQQSELQAVYVISDNNVSLRQIRLGNRDRSGMVEILSGITAGETIALDPVSAGIYVKENNQ